MLDRVGKVKISEVQDELDSKIDLNNFIEFVEENGETYVRFSSMGEYYVRRMRETSYLPQASMISHAPAGKIMEGSVHVEELEGIVNSLSTCSYVEKLKVVYYNPDRKVAFSVRFSSMGEYYVRRMRETSYLPQASMISHAPAGKIMEGSVQVEELEGIVNSLSTCSYVEKLKVVYYNPDRKVAFSKFALAQNYHEQMIITLEYKCKKGVARVDVYTVGGTEKEMD